MKGAQRERQRRVLGAQRPRLGHATLLPKWLQRGDYADIRRHSPSARVHLHSRPPCTQHQTLLRSSLASGEVVAIEVDASQLQQVTADIVAREVALDRADHETLRPREGP